MASYGSASCNRLARAALAAILVLLAGAWIGEAAAATKRFRVEPPETVVDEPVWVCLIRGGRPAVLEIEQAGVAQPAGEPNGIVPRLRLSLTWPTVGPLELNDGVRRWRAAESGARPEDRTGDSPNSSHGLPAGTFLLSAEGFEPETLRVREASPAEQRDSALLRRVRFHLERGDSARAARILEDFLARSRNPSAIVLAKLELLAVLPFTEYAGRPKLWLSEWVARHHQNCVVGAGIERWLAIVPPEEGRAALRELASAYVGTRASVVSQELLRLGSGTANE